MLGKSLANMFLLILLLSSGEAIHDDVSTSDHNTQSFSILSFPPSYPSCFNEGTTWSTEEAVDIVEGTQSLYSCQDLCFQSPTCQQFTWYDGQASSLALTCFLYSSTTTEYPCTNCVSGPQSCICDVLKPQKHGSWFCPPSSDPSTCHLECHPGYVSDNGTVITCQHGEWSSAPSCVAAVALITGNYASPNNQVEVYSEGLHKSLPDLPVGQLGWRRSHSLDLVDSSVLLCGGKATRMSCLVLTSSLQWVTHSTTTSERWDHSSVSALGQLHLMGGRTPQGASYSTSEFLARSSTTWSEGWQLLEDSHAACTAKVDPEVAIMTGGGWTPSSVISYNVTSGAARRLQDLISPRSYHGCSYIRDAGFRGVLVAGGSVSGSSEWDFSQIYDINTGEWSTTGRLTTDRHTALRMFVIGEQILASGGLSRNARPLSSVDRFNLTSRTWTAAENMLEGKWYHAVTGVPPSVVGMGSD